MKNPWRQLASSKACRIAFRHQYRGEWVGFWRAVQEVIDEKDDSIWDKLAPKEPPTRKIHPGQIRAIQRNVNGLSLRDQAMIYCVSEEEIKRVRKLPRPDEVINPPEPTNPHAKILRDALGPRWPFNLIT